MRAKRFFAVIAATVIGAVGLASPAYAAPTHHYVAAVEAAGTGNAPPAGTTGLSGIFTVEQPTVAADDYHSLMEISACKYITVSGSNQRNCVEFGWEVNPGVYGDANPHLFSGWWKHGVFQGRNNCVDAAGTPNAGDSILGAVGTMKTFGINYYPTTPAGGGWWLSYNPTSGPTTWVCHIPQSRWTNPGPGGLPAVPGFTTAEELQWFGEVAEEPGGGESEMGDGSCGSTGTAPLSPLTDPAYIAVMRSYQGASTFTNSAPYKYSTDPTKWDHASTGTTSMTLGGDGTSC